MKFHQKHRLVVLKSHSKTNVSIPFEIPQGLQKLVIDYSYSPKELDDEKESIRLVKENLLRDGYEDTGDYGEYLPLKNLITLSLDSPKGYVGAAHRQAPIQSHEISASFSSVGFVKTEIYEGEWVLTLNLHAVVTDQCTCEIEVMGYE